MDIITNLELFTFLITTAFCSRRLIYYKTKFDLFFLLILQYFCCYFVQSKKKELAADGIFLNAFFWVKSVFFFWYTFIHTRSKVLEFDGSAYIFIYLYYSLAGDVLIDCLSWKSSWDLLMRHYVYNFFLFLKMYHIWDSFSFYLVFTIPIQLVNMHDLIMFGLWIIKKPKQKKKKRSKIQNNIKKMLPSSVIWQLLHKFCILVVVTCELSKKNLPLIS